MKKLATSALAVCLLVLVGCAEGTSSTPESEAIISEASNKIEANVSGMDCTGCSGSIASAVEGIDGVTACAVDLKSGDVSVALADDADTDAKMLEVEKAITSLSDGKFTVNTISVFTGATDVETNKEASDSSLPTTDEIGAAAQDVVDTVSEEVQDVAKDIEIPSLGGE